MWRVAWWYGSQESRSLFGPGQNRLRANTVSVRRDHVNARDHALLILLDNNLNCGSHHPLPIIKLLRERYQGKSSDPSAETWQRQALEESLPSGKPSQCERRLTVLDFLIHEGRPS
jgi:hypothetical protein